MNPPTLPGRAPGTYVPYGRRSYYRPDPLPPEANFEFDDDFRDALQETIFQLGRLDGISRESPANPLLYTTLVRREAVESTLIEGGQLTLEDVFRRSEIETGSTVEKDIQEALNYERVVRKGAEEVEESGEITVALLKDLHSELLEDVRGETEPLGEFRTDPTHIPSPEAGIEPFVPPAPDHVDGLMENLEDFMQSGSEHHDLVNVGIVHYQFETIHPFADGNGRLGRILITLQLIRNGFLSRPYLYPSAYFNRHKVEYAKRMRAVSERGEWEPWLEFFVEGIRAQASEAVERTERLQDLRQRYEHQYGHGKTAADRLALRLFEQPYLTVAEAANILEMSEQSARNGITELVDQGVLEEVTGKERYQEFKAVDIFDVLNEPLE
ncbi:Fic family protein [Halosimplex halobium]|uniref:Fic family protein n=1 Tax=Halosimplex halobium TaxID=3396618 RepID=UPI003F57F4BF